MAISLSGMMVLPNGMLIPGCFDPSKIDEYMLKEQNCKKLKTELRLELGRSSLTEIKALFEKRGFEFLIEMLEVDPWENVNNGGRSILENVLQEMQFNLPEETLVYLLNYFVDNSEQAKATNMNFLHVLARNCFSDKAISVLKTAIEYNPQLLRARMRSDEDLDMTPLEMIIRTSFNESLINYIFTKYQESVGFLASEDKSKLLSHAGWLNGSGIYSTALIGKRLMERIRALPEDIH